jgi:hypothetical protein
MRRRYWAVAYADVVRWAGPCRTAVHACYHAYGMVDYERMTAMEYPHGNPKYSAHYKKVDFLKALGKRHQAKTGDTLR